MTRLRNIVEFFSHDAGASDGQTIIILESKYGNDGYAAWFKLLERLASADNHFIHCKDEAIMIWLAGKLKLHIDKLEEFLGTLANLDAIDKTLWQEHRVIWSENFLDRVIGVYKNRRREAFPTKPSFDLQGNLCNLQGNHCNLQVGDNEIPLSNNSRKPYGEFKNVLLSDVEKDKLIDKFGESDFKEKVSTLSEGIKSKGYKYDDHYATILSWDRKDKRDGKKKELESEYVWIQLGGKYGDGWGGKTKVVKRSDVQEGDTILDKRVDKKDIPKDFLGKYGHMGQQ